MREASTPEQSVVLVGSPFSATGRGGTVISFFRSLRTVGMATEICDAFPGSPSESVDSEVDNEIRDHLAACPGQRLNIYHINGDQIDSIQAHLQHSLANGAYNIMYPFWELGKYPAIWAEKIRVFDEVWACSRFIEDTMTEVFTKPVYHMPLAVKVKLARFLGRQYFSLPEWAYLLLFFFDFRSYIDRKNPDAVMRVLEEVAARRPHADIRAVIKVHGTESSPKAHKDFIHFADRIKQSSVKERIILINNLYSDNEVKNLIRCCDCFISLHRSEGYGLGMAEAMYLGKPVIGTGYSGNMDFMDEGNSCLVNYQLIPVERGQYPFGEGQVWAEPDLEQAAHYVVRLLDDAEFGRRLGGIASRRIRTGFSYLSMGLRYRQRLVAIDGLGRLGRAYNEIAMRRSLNTTVLIVSHVRFHPPTAGNEIRLNRLIKYLKKMGYRVAVLVNPFSEYAAMDRDVRREVYSLADYYEEIGESLGDLATDPSVLVESLPRPDPVLDRWRFMEDTFCSPAVLARAKVIIEEFAPSIIIAEYIWMSRVLGLAPAGVLRVIDLIDKFSNKAENVLSHGIADSLAATAEEERAFLDRADAAIAIQKTEAQAFRELRPKCRIVTAGVDFGVEAAVAGSTERPVERQVLIIASGNHLNVKCVQEFLDEAWPGILLRVPRCSLRIVGKVCGSLTVSQENVELTPYVARLEEAYARASVVVNPVYAGTGLKIKSAEALGHGKALVTWPEGVAGIPAGSPSPYVVCHSWAEMAAEISRIANDAEARRVLETRARDFAEANFRDDVVYAELAECFASFCPPKHERKILCLYLRYGADEHAEGLEQLQRWYRNNLSRSRAKIWIVDNRISGDFDGYDLSGHRLLGGDNSCWEFSGWQKVVNAHRSELRQYDVIHFVTSAFNKLYTRYLDHFSEDQLDLVVRDRVCLGHIDSYDEPIEILGEMSQSWIRTCFFFLSPASLSKVGPLVSFNDHNLFFDSNGMFKPSGPISEKYKENISRWLSGGEMQGLVWHGAIESAGKFRAKAMAILNEHMLAIRLRRAGVKLVDLHWLDHEYKESGTATEILVPSCEEQVRMTYQLRLKGHL
jgi:glycosyltransferase involved in cell wall biosynthesis